MKYTVDYYEGDEDCRPCWFVLEWRTSTAANILERCRTEAEAESFARAYSTVAFYEAATY